MALNFPNSPTNGQVFVDTNGQKWTYESSTNSWTAEGAPNGGMVYKGGINITVAPPAGAVAGWLYTVNVGGTANAGFTGLTGNIAVGTQIVNSGTAWQVVGTTGPWTRTGTEIRPATAGDSVFTTGAVKVGGTTAAPNITLDASGKIGIGTQTTPTSPPLYVWGEGVDGDTVTLYSGIPSDPAVIATGSSASGLQIRGGASGSSSSPGGQIDLIGGTRSSEPGVIKFRTGLTTNEQPVRGYFSAAGDLLVGGTLPASPKIKLEANGGVSALYYFFTDATAALRNAYFEYEEVSGGLNAYNFQNGDPQTGATLLKGATNWAPYTSESRLKDIRSDADTDQCWTLIRDIELKRYYYKDQDDKSGVSYMGPMADWLGVQDPELLIDTGRTDEHGPIHTYNQGLLDMKALAALSAALKRIEDLEAKVAALEGGAPDTVKDSGTGTRNR